MRLPWAVGRRKTVEHAAIDSTGLECSATINYFAKRRDRVENLWKTVIYSYYPKLAIVCRTCDHFILAFSSKRGSGLDVDEFKDLVSVAARRVKLRCIVADARCDSESNHQFARESLDSRSILPAKHERPSRKPANDRYRRFMQVRFDRKTYGKRVQVENVASMIKRRLGNNARVRSRQGQVRELALVVLTHNLMILWCSVLFYRAGPSGFSAGLFPPQGPKPDCPRVKARQFSQTAQHPSLKGGFCLPTQKPEGSKINKAVSEGLNSRIQSIKFAAWG
jgi:hypothetical protein